MTFKRKKIVINNFKCIRIGFLINTQKQYNSRSRQKVVKGNIDRKMRCNCL